ncbi:MAG TPA: S-adenosylmethionine decarboxylase, partial [Candidatus Poseidoniaceae archaeon]|nr:S-adenosylmethionine decarboxylase [Candidatus Poseidoniaceae archaeon]
MDSLPRGKHVILDCSGAFDANGDSVLKILEHIVDNSNARRVHSHVENFDGTVSPLGFAAIVLIDESHVTAHCYSEIGLLAIDIFTCGNTNPNLIADKIEMELMKVLPKLVINNRHSVSRFTTIPSDSNVRNFVDTHFNHFNAGELRRCAVSLKQFL